MRAQSASLLALALGGLIASLLVRAIKRNANHHEDRQRRPAPPDADDPRWGTGEERPQIAGKSCAACHERITVAFEGAACELCKRACHTKCVTRHVADSHKAHEDGTPYR